MPGHQQFINSLSAGLIAGIRTILGSAAMVTLLLPPALAAGIPQGLDVMLIGGAILGAAVACMSSYPGVVAQVQDGPIVILGVMITSLVAASPQAPPGLVLQAALASTAIAAVAAGIVFYGLGAYRLGALVRFIPFPVIGGFLAGSGYLILRGSFPVLTGLDLAQASAALLFEPMRLARWLPGALLGVAMLLILRRFSHVLIVPGMLLGSVLLFHLVIRAYGVPTASAQAAGWLLGPFPPNNGLALPAWLSLPAEGWLMLASHASTFGAIILVSVVALLLNTSGLEMATQSELDINRELRATGVANLLAGLCGGPVGFHALSASLLGHRMGANSRVVGITSAAMCAAALFAGTSMLAYFPKAVLGGLLLCMGAGLMVEWLYDGWHKLPRQDYMIVVLIVLVIGGAGILAGVAVGVLVAMAIFVLNYSRVRVIRQELTGAEFHSDIERPPQAQHVLRTRGQVIRIIRLEGFIFFGTAYGMQTHVQALLQHAAKAPPRHLLLDFADVRAIDSSAISVFGKILALCRRHDCELLLTSMQPHLRQQFRQAGLGEDAAGLRWFGELDRALEQCEDRLLAETPPSADAAASTIWQRIAAALPPGTPLEEFMAYLEPRDYAKGDALMRQGTPSTEMYFIEAGRVSLHLVLEDGRTLRMRSISAGTTVGEVGLYLKQPRTGTAIADDPTRAYVLSLERLQAMATEKPALANALQQVFIGLLAERLAGASGLAQRLLR